MRLEYFSAATLSQPAEDLLHFDMDSIRQVVASLRGGEPALWLVDPASYEKNGRVMRDSPSPRLLAYSSSDRTVYACDGCNACTRRLEVSLQSLTASQLRTFAEDSDLRIDLLERLTSLLDEGLKPGETLPL